ncbi:MAG: alpha-galactosidase [Lachnospiraceae bacterium]|nr:alpha-galactosidase [Lachnospiraceae bacterium]
MAEKRKIRCQIYCQKGKEIDAELSMEAGIYENDGIRIEVTENAADGGQYGEIQLNMKNESCRENFNLRMEKPIRVYLPMDERPEKITAMYLYNEWWTRPAFVEKFQDIPDLTQVAFFKYHNRFACFIPMVGRAFKTYMVSGTETEICLEMTAYLGGQRELDEPLYLSMEAPTLTEAVHKAFAWLAEYKGIRMREKRRVPEMFHYLGWCSWDAFYTEVSEEKIRQKAEELVQKKVPVKWMIIDDGWLSARDELLYDFVPDKAKFPNGFKDMIKEIKEKGDFRWFGVWHALGGYWGGISQGSVLDCNENPYLYKTVNGKLVPSPLTGERFYRDWYQELRQEGIDFVKVDGQSAVPYYFENSLPVSEAARGMNQALESGASYMDGAIINCMGMAMENILARPTSAISRNSDDFVPNKENGFAEHLLQNAFNAIYHNELYCCDWDMFWTKHEYSVKHSLLRAISGGPVYFSDKIGDTVPEVLKPLMYGDGRILMMERSAKPTEDCIFSNPMEIGVLKLHNVASWGECGKGGGIAAYNLTSQRQSYAFKPTDIPDIEVTDAYWVYDFFGRKVFCLNCSESYEGILEADGFAWFVILPKKKTGSCLGLLNKYAGFMAVESMQESDDTLISVVTESGVLGWISEREPRQVTTGTADVTKNVQRDGNLYSVLLPETSAKTVLTITL